MARVLMITPDERLLRALRASPLLAEHSVDVAVGPASALQQLRERAVDVLVTAPDSQLPEDVAILAQATAIRPGIRVVMLTRRATPEEVIAALRKRAFACFSDPFDAAEIADMVARAAEATPGADGIEVVSATPEWLSVRVNCRLLSAERLINFLSALRSDVPAAPREDFLLAFREVLLNAMEHGAGFDPDQVVDVTAVRTERTMVFHLRDPGPGFDLHALSHAAVSSPDDLLLVTERRVSSGLRPGGFGLLLARRIVDEMIHNERANEVILVKHLS